MRTLILLLLTLCLGCGSSQRDLQAATATSLAVAANAALPILVARYDKAGERVIAQASTRAEADAGLALVQTEWRPVWDAWAVLARAQDTWARTLETEGDLDEGLWGLRTAYCRLAKVWPSDIPALPLNPFPCSAEEVVP